MNIYNLIRPLLFKLPAETAHNLGLCALNLAAKTGITSLISKPKSAITEVMGLKFTNPVGLAAGLDKNGCAIDGLAACGFGFIEVGTVTPKAQNGNPKPRLFRLPEDEALINRMGFNNLGTTNLVTNIKRAKFHGVIGVNIGKNLTTSIENAHLDYCSALKDVYGVADYVAVNLSSPNTPDLRHLQFGDELKIMLQTLLNERENLANIHARNVPLLIKIAPDLNENEIKQISSTLLEFGINGVIATNTTLERSNLQNTSYRNETGGLSGKPLFNLSNQIISQLHAQLGNKIPIIAAGGIVSADDALTKIKLGAKLVQLYTGFIYQGPNLVRECVKALNLR